MINYFVDGVNFKDYGVFVSDSKGIVNRPKLKPMAAVSWDNYHGEAVDLSHKFYEPREITLSCFIKASSRNEFITSVIQFEQLFDKAGSQRLVIDTGINKPLIYEVYCKDEISITKKWSESLMVGTFELKLIEPEPVKKVFKFTRTSEAVKTAIIVFTTTKLLNIYWGDGSVDADISGSSKRMEHIYAADGDYYIVMTGCIDEVYINAWNVATIWNKI